MGVTKPVPLSVGQLAEVVNKRDRDYDVVLAEPQKWINWESALTLLARDVFIVGVASDEEFPLYVSFSRESDDAQAMPYDENMRFVFKSAPSSA